MRLRVRRSGPLVGRVALPGDLHIGQQALVWAALAEGPSCVHGLGSRQDHRLLAAGLAELGVSICALDDGYRIEGVGLHGLSLPRGALRAGDSPTTLELLVALLAGQPFGTRVEASGSALEHALRTLIEPLRARGANVAGRRVEDELRAPIAVAPALPGELLDSVEIAIPFGDASTKLGLLLSGLYVRGVTAVQEGMLSRDHVERALLALGAPIESAAGMTLLDTSGGVPAWAGFDWTIPGDFTLASFLVAAALGHPGSDLRIERVALNPTRTAFLDALRGSGASVSVTPKGDQAGNEPIGDLRARGSRLAQVRVGGERALGLLDEVPALAALCLCARDRVSIRDVAPLRSRGPDALKATVALLAQFGIACTVYDDGFEIDPPAALRGTQVGAEVPPPQRLLACLLGLAAEGETRIEGAEQLDALYPGFLGTLSALGASVEREEGA